MFAVPNELGTNNALTTMLSKATGLLSGVADTVVILPTKDLIFVEFKTDIGKQSPAQKDFEKRVTNLGYKYFIIRTFDEFKKIIITLSKNGMNNLATLYIKADVLKTLYDTIQKKGSKGVELTISTSDKNNDYNQNVSAWVAQTKEEREAEKKKFYVGNGRVFWGDGVIPKNEINTTNIIEDIESESTELPFQ